MSRSFNGVPQLVYAISVIFAPQYQLFGCNYSWYWSAQLKLHLFNNGNCFEILPFFTILCSLQLVQSFFTPPPSPPSTNPYRIREISTPLIFTAHGKVSYWPNNIQTPRFPYPKYLLSTLHIRTYKWSRLHSQLIQWRLTLSTYMLMARAAKFWLVGWIYSWY